MLIYLPNLVTKVQQDLIESISLVLILGKIAPTGSLANSFPFKDDLYGNSDGGRPVVFNVHQASGRGSGGKVLGMKRTMSIIPFDDRDGVIWFDGKLMPWRDAKLHVLSHGLHYGSCVFEGERSYAGPSFQLGESRKSVGYGQSVSVGVDLGGVVHFTKK